jgi:hypothetical protein
MHAPALIRTHHGIETPAPGTWAIDHGWAVEAVWRSGLRLRRVDTRALGGTLTVGSEPGSVGLVVAVDTRHVDPVPADALRLRTTAIRPTPDGRWTVAAAVDPVLDGQTGRTWTVARVDLRYHGVFRIGDGARARLALRARVAVPAGPTGVAAGRRRAGTVDLVIDVDAEAPRALVAAARDAPVRRG